MQKEKQIKKYDIAAYVWPSYTGDDIRARQFWPQGIGEWESVIKMKPKFEGHQWPRKPLWGYQNEANPDVMAMQIDAAVSHGVNTFIYDWYWYDRRPFLENCLNDGFLKAPNNEKMKFYIMWANHNATYLWDIRNSNLDPDEWYWKDENVVWLGYQDRKEFEVIARRIIDKYFSRPNYYKIDGKPVFSIYEVASLIKGLGGVKQAREALDWFRTQSVKAGFNGIHLQAIVGGAARILIDNGKADLISALGFDSATNYNLGYYNDESKRTMDYADIPLTLRQKYERFDAECAAPYFPNVAIGWDDNSRFTNYRSPVFLNNTPQNFEKVLRIAKEYLDKRPEMPPLVTVNSWNEWTEDSYLQPDDRYGCGYLEAVKKVFGGTFR